MKKQPRRLSGEAVSRSGAPFRPASVPLDVVVFDDVDEEDLIGLGPEDQPIAVVDPGLGEVRTTTRA